MDVFFSVFMEQAKSQGFSVLLLMLAVWYFYNRQIRQEKQSKHAQEQIVRYLQEDRIQLVKLVEELRDVVEQNTAVLRAIEKKL